MKAHFVTALQNAVAMRFWTRYRVGTVYRRKSSVDPSIISVLIGGGSIVVVVVVVVVGRVLGTIGFQNYSNRSLPLEATTPEHSPHHPYSHKDAAYYCTI